MNNEHINFMALAIKNRDKKAMTHIRTDNSAVIANMQKTIDALVEVGKQFSQIIQVGSPSCQKGVVEKCKCTNCVSDRFEDLSLPVSEKAN